MYSNESMLEQHGNLMKWVESRRKGPCCDWGNQARVSRTAFPPKPPVMLGAEWQKKKYKVM